ncbi:MAG: transglycosylase SLT domain-containing protein [Bacteroidales bacterium]|nr:transglycosylase SLT domain-containing protein [Bacteroidales bacterium]
MDKKKIIIIALLIVVFIIVSLILAKHEGERSVFFRSDADSLNCVILVDSRITSAQGRAAGFCYELLQNYADETGKTVRILAADNGAWKNLGDGVDIIVTDSLEIPANLAGKVTASIPVRNDLVMVFGEQDKELVNNVNFWLSSFKKSRIYERMCVRFFRSYKLERIAASDTPVTYLSPYDDIIKKYSNFVGLDWILIAAITYQESQYYLGAVSEKSAQGLMQLKPSTAARYGIEDLYNPELNIKAGTLHFNYLYNLYKNEGLDSLNVLKFALASYNAGEARIGDCRVFAMENGYDPNQWDSVAASFDENPSFLGKQTVSYVDDIIYRYGEYKKVIE